MPTCAGCLHMSQSFPFFSGEASSHPYAASSASRTCTRTLYIYYAYIVRSLIRYISTIRVPLSHILPHSITPHSHPSLRPLYVLEQFSRKISRFSHVLYVFLRMFAFRPLKKSKKSFTFFLGRKVLSFKRKPIFCEPLLLYFVIFFHKNIWPYRKKLVLLHSQMRPRPHERKKKKRSLEYLHNF